MDNYGHNDNQTESRENNNSQPNARIPEYSFWAEQMSGSSSNQKNAFENNTGSMNAYGSNNRNVTYGTVNNSSYFPNDSVYFPKNEETTPLKKRRPITFIVKAICFGILAGAAFIGSLELYHRLNPEPSDGGRYILGGTGTSNEDSSKTRLRVGSTDLGTVNTTSRDAITNMVEGTMPAIVSITSVSTQTDMWFGREYSSEGSGSGIIVGQNEKELLIATNNHVVEGTNKITVTFIDGSEMEAVIKGTDATADLAVITVDITGMENETLKAIEVAKLGDSDKVKVGQMTIAIGNAMGYGQSVTVGYVSAKDRKIEFSDNYTYKTMVLLQTDAAINPGNSGGALLNVEGEVIGINTVKYASNEVEGMGYAIPISRAIPIINDLMNREILKLEEQGFLGVGPTDVTEAVSQMYNIPMGVFLSEVMENSAAEKAGLKQGDIITKINDTEITSRVQLSELISSIRSGTEIEVTFMRGVDGGYKEQKVKAVLGTRSVE